MNNDLWELAAAQTVASQSQGQGQALTVSPLYTVEPQPTMGAALFDRWLKFIDRSSQTAATYTKAAKRFLDYMAERNISQPTRETILEYKAAMNAQGLKPSSVNSHLAALRQFFSWAEAEGLYKNIAKNIHSEKQTKGHKKDYFTKAQFNDILSRIDRSTLKGKRDYAMLAVMAVCGLRDIEVARANIEDIRLAGDNVVIYIQGKGRTEKDEYQKLEKAEPCLREYLAARGETDKSAPLFANTSNHTSHKGQGARMTTQSISRLVKGYIKAAGFLDERHTAHSLRHSAITWTAQGKKRTIWEVAQFARHANIATTMIYIHEQDKAENQCAADICEGLAL